LAIFLPLGGGKTFYTEKAVLAKIGFAAKTSFATSLQKFTAKIIFPTENQVRSIVLD